MALARYESVAVNLAGDVIPNAQVEVRRDQPGRPVVPLFSDREGTIALGNPFTTDSEGKFGFHAPGGVYYIRVFTGPAQQPLQQYVRRYQAIGTAAERDIEDLASALEAGTATFPTLAELEAFTPAVEGVGGKVTTGEDAGFYHFDDIGEVWVFDRPLFDSLARMNVTGGTADAIEAEIASGVDSASVVMLFIEPTATNTGPVTINGKSVLTTDDEELSAGQWVAGRTYWFSDETTHYKLRTDSDVSDLVAQAEAAAAAAIAAQAAAEAAAAGAGVTDGDKGGVIVSSAGTDWQIKDGDKGDVVVSGDGGVWTVPILADGDKGDVVLSADGTVWEIDPDVKASIRDTRNFCWAGSFTHWQRGTSFAAIAARMGTADGWTFGRSSSATGATIAQVQGSRGSNLAARVQRNAAQTGTENMAFVFNLGIADTRPLVDRDAIVSFRARAGADFSAASGLLTLQVKTSTSLTEQAIVAAAGTYTTGDTTADGDTFALTTSWQDFSLPITFASDIAQMALRFVYTPVGTAGAADYFEIEEVQVELGSVASDFVPVDTAYSMLKAREQYRKSYNYAVTPGTVNYNGSLRAAAVGTTSGKAVQISKQFDPPMRASPTITLYSPQTGTAAKMAQGSTADIDATAVHIGDGGFGIQNGATAVASDPYYVHYTAEAKL